MSFTAIARPRFRGRAASFESYRISLSLSLSSTLYTPRSPLSTAAAATINPYLWLTGHPLLLASKPASHQLDYIHTYFTPVQHIPPQSQCLENKASVGAHRRPLFLCKRQRNRSNVCSLASPRKQKHSPPRPNNLIVSATPPPPSSWSKAVNIYLPRQAPAP